MKKFGLSGKLIAHPGQADALAEVLLEAAESMQHVDGCEQYWVSLSTSEPDAVWVTEVWRDEEAHQASLTLESTKALIQKGRPFIAGMEGSKLHILGGKGV